MKHRSMRLIIALTAAIMLTACNASDGEDVMPSTPETSASSEATGTDLVSRLREAGVNDEQIDDIIDTLEEESGTDQQVGVGPTQDAPAPRTSPEVEYDLWCATYDAALTKLAEYESAYAVARANGPKNSPEVNEVVAERDAWIAEVRQNLDDQYFVYVAAAKEAGEGVRVPAMDFTTREMSIILGMEDVQKLYCARQ